MDHGAALDLLVAQCEERLTLVDVGARWGANQRWGSVGAAADMICFEPDVVECARLNAGRPPNVMYLPVGLAETEGERELVVTAEPACSSLFPPVRALHEQYGGLSIMRPQSTLRIPCRRLDDVLAEVGAGPVTALKLDTQGSELGVLKGGVGALRTCSVVDIEVQFNPLYEGAGLFCDVDRFMRDHGFVLWRLENLVHYAPEAMEAAGSSFTITSDPGCSVTVSAPNGQLFWADAHYVRAELPRTGPARLDARTALPGAIMAAAYGYWDLALDVLCRSTMAGMVPEIVQRLAPVRSV